MPARWQDYPRTLAQNRALGFLLLSWGGLADHYDPVPELASIPYLICFGSQSKALPDSLRRYRTSQQQQGAPSP
ncbi:hypothetical protein GCM10011378_42280 [Hymenobacter glacieicola]|uniref:Uncharacterized protein n=1 Tax=Hymenobacter glacieicola TaxID=1562124 RepID=A0ABQ1X655_9BACT|nr:hypothetical protein GCM10011378_42280 [Hymenobacter glacieicola]